MPRKVKSAEPELAKVEAAPAAEAKKRAPRAKKIAAEPAAPKTQRARGAAATHKARTAPAEIPALRLELYQEEIARQAYFYWLERGGAHGHHNDDWLRAEREVRRRSASA